MPRRTAKRATVPVAARKGVRRAGAGAAAGRLTEGVLAAFAHDVRTPLTGIVALAELLATSELGARERAWVATLKSNADHLAALTTLVVDAAKARRTGRGARAEPFDPRRLAQAVAGSLAARAQSKGLACRVAIDDALPPAARGDAVWLRAALENLIDNAVKFTERGEVRFAASATRAGAARWRLTFRVSDSGIGLAPKEVARLFRPFAQANATIAPRFGGSGLGLAQARTLARAMRGDLVVKSLPGRGSTFCLTAMVARGDAADAASGTAAAGPPAAAARGLRILCAEDNPYGRVVLNAVLTELGHRTDFVGGADAAVAALTRATEGGEPYDAVLMDVTLGHGDGMAATRAIRALAPAIARVPVIGISGREGPAVEAAARAAGMDAYLVKPVSPQLLARTIARTLGRPRAQIKPKSKAAARKARR
ncbi:MAG: response regulator [Proteobacteria bacterium]|nr:response regulator [Pseudomonadota bacterium]